MSERRAEELLRGISVPVTPSDSFAHCLLERLEGELTGQGLSVEELDQENGEELPYREAMSLLAVDPLTCVDPELHLDDAVQGDRSPPTAD